MESEIAAGGVAHIPAEARVPVDRQIVRLVLVFDRAAEGERRPREYRTRSREVVPVTAKLPDDEMEPPATFSVPMLTVLPVPPVIVPAFVSEPVAVR